jgi:hypothetical protein
MIGGIFTVSIVKNNEILDFVDDGECPACGSKNENVTVKSILERSGTGWTVTRREVEANIQTRYICRTNGACQDCGAPEKHEHLHRSCLICNFNWSEEVKSPS